MSVDGLVTERFEEHRPRLRAVAYRMLGSISDADDAVQEAWVRLNATDSSTIDNLGGWLTTVVGRICLNLLRSRRTRREDSLEVRIPDPVVAPVSDTDPEREALYADSVGLALMVVLQTLGPPERLAFVLHDMFGVPFDEIAATAGRTPASVRQLASRARRRVQGASATPDVELASQRKVVDAFFTASRRGDLDALVSVLDPDVVIRSDGGTRRPSLTGITRGGTAVAAQAVTYRRLSPFVYPAVVNGVAGVIVAPNGSPFSVMAFTVRGGRITAIDSLVDPDRLRRLHLTAFADAEP
jgi:RNA polymerase sigma factor (sigma-70 family)